MKGGRLVLVASVSPLSSLFLCCCFFFFGRRWRHRRLLAPITFWVITRNASRRRKRRVQFRRYPLTPFLYNSRIISWFDFRLKLVFHDIFIRRTRVGIHPRRRCRGTEGWRTRRWEKPSLSTTAWWVLWRRGDWDSRLVRRWERLLMSEFLPCLYLLHTSPLGQRLIGNQNPTHLVPKFMHCMW